MEENPLYLIIHGHFYQPPRENPWTGLIENQKSAYPYHDWNERINSECYRPNTNAKILDNKEKIIGTLNNFEMLSFNIGPTLANWLENFDKESHDKIVRADLVSQKRCGFGNAIAQVYNHIIMPLADSRDKETEIIWAIADFKKRFNRDPLGLWLSETAIDEKTIQVLIDFNIKFVLLSPIQALSVYDKKTKKWKDVSAGSIDTTIPYLLTDKKGRSITCLFFDKDLSWGVSFGDLLTSAQKLADKIVERAKTGQGNLSFICTDGETFGHHKRFSEMCLAYLFEIESKKRKIKVVNPAYYLSMFKAEVEVKLKRGGTSWSCPHGIERWRDNCGCATEFHDNWNQKWRKGLREGLNKLRKEINKIYEKEISSFIPLPWKIRNEYIESILGQISGSDLITKEAKRDVTQKEIDKTLSLLEAEKNMLFSFTSCGWFFSDITGLEPIQNLRYAVRSIFLAKSYDKLRDPIVKILKSAKSNKEKISADILFLKLLEKDGATYHKWVHSFALQQLIKGKTESIKPPEFEVKIIDSYYSETDIDSILVYASIRTRFNSIDRIFLSKSSLTNFTSIVREVSSIEKPLSSISVFDNLAEGFYTLSIRDIDYDYFCNILRNYLVTRWMKISDELLINIFSYLIDGVIPRDLHDSVIKIYNERIIKIPVNEMTKEIKLSQISSYFSDLILKVCLQKQEIF